MTLLGADRIQRLELFDGEDTCDLMHVIQDSFGMEFTSDELIAAETVWQLSEIISEKLRHPRSERCLTAIVFYRLRRAFSELFRSPRARIRPDTRLDELLPWTERLSRWRQLQGYLGLSLPRLMAPTWLLGLALVTSVAVAWAYAQRFTRFTMDGLVTGGVWFLAFFLLVHLVRPLARTLPRACKTVGELATVVVARNYAKLATEVGGSSPKELFSALRQLIAVELGKDVRKITPETRFPEGLNIR
jgi:acyl carrier protein